MAGSLLQAENRMEHMSSTFIPSLKINERIGVGFTCHASHLSSPKRFVYLNEQIPEKGKKKVNKANFPLHTHTNMANENIKNQRG